MIVFLIVENSCVSFFVYFLGFLHTYKINSISNVAPSCKDLLYVWVKYIKNFIKFSFLKKYLPRTSSNQDWLFSRFVVELSLWDVYSLVFLSIFPVASWVSMHQRQIFWGYVSLKVSLFYTQSWLIVWLSM